jgi:methionyl-tRNA formyltransferase
MAQDESLATKAPLIRKGDGAVDFTEEAPGIANRLRGFSPWPGVQFLHLGRSIKILEAAALGIGRTEAAPCGSVIGIAREGVDVACSGGSTLRLRRVQPESRGAVSAFDFANGAKLKPGAVLGPSGGEARGSRLSEPSD